MFAFTRWIHLTGNQLLRLPFPDDTTFKYASQLIGPGLRPEDPARCLTSEMCLPIFPNTYHPSADREALQPRTGPFPFSNCYHWFGPDMVFDMRLWNNGQSYTAEERVSLPASEQVRLERIRSGDVWRAFDAMEAQNAAHGAGALPKEDTQEEQELVEESHVARSAESEQQDEPSADESTDYDESESDSASSNSASHEDLSDHFALMDIFGIDEDENDDLLPIVNVWPDVGAHFNEDDVPNPMELAEQFSQIVRYGPHSLIVTRANIRDRIITESKARSRWLRASDWEKGCVSAKQGSGDE